MHYHLPYTGKYTFTPKVLMPVNNFVVQLPKGMTFAAAAGIVFRPIPQNAAVQTLLLKNALPGKPLEFSVSGNGSLPREEQGTATGQQSGSGMGAQDNGGQDTSVPGSQPGGGIGNPINTPDPLSKFKWWILGGLALLLSAAAAFLLRKPLPGAVIEAAPAQAVSTPTGKSGALLSVLKEELFTLETENASGTIKPEEYAQVKAALETVLKRALKRN
jgi:hypothetical protein